MNSILFLLILLKTVDIIAANYSILMANSGNFGKMYKKFWRFLWQNFAKFGVSNGKKLQGQLSGAEEEKNENNDLCLLNSALGSWIGTLQDKIINSMLNG